MNDWFLQIPHIECYFNWKIHEKFFHANFFASISTRAVAIYYCVRMLLFVYSTNWQSVSFEKAIFLSKASSCSYTFKFSSINFCIEKWNFRDYNHDFIIGDRCWKVNQLPNQITVGYRRILAYGIVHWCVMTLDIFFFFLSFFLYYALLRWVPRGRIFTARFWWKIPGISRFFLFQTNIQISIFEI